MDTLDIARFFTLGIDTSQAIPASYEPSLVVASYLVATLAGFAFLRFTRRIIDLGDSPLRVAWMSAGALTMGLGVWAMHFLAMLAYRIPLPVEYDPIFTALSVLPAILGSAAALHFVARRSVGFGRLLLGAALMGSGIGIMHYTGMAALRFEAVIRYDPMLFITSIVVAVALAFFSLGSTQWMVRRLDTPSTHWLEIAGALIMGLAVSGMHYTAMTSAFCFAAPDKSIGVLGLDATVFAAVTTTVAILVLVVAIIGVIFDRRLTLEITRHTQALDLLRQREQNLAIQELKYREMFEDAPVAMYRCLNRKFIEVNRAFERLLGYSANELVGLTRRDLIPTDDRENTPHMSGVSDEKEFSVEHRMIRKDGTQIWVHTSRSNIGVDKDGRHMIGHVHDISTRKIAEERLLQVQKMEALGNLAGGIAHDFNNMLLPIMALAGMTKNDLPPDDPAQENLSMILEAATQAAELVKQILAFSRQNEQQFALIDVAEFMAEARSLLRNVLPSSITIVDDIQPVGHVMGDRAQLLSVIMNIGTNAAQAIGGKVGTLTIQLDRMVAGREQALRCKTIPEGQPCARLAIADTGCGMDGATLSKIFDPFFTTKPVGEGTGLGLAMVHGIIEQHRGMIEVESEVDVGTRFEIYLPIDAKIERLTAA